MYSDDGYQIPRSFPAVYDVLYEAPPEPPKTDTIPTRHNMNNYSNFTRHLRSVCDADDKLNRQTQANRQTASSLTKPSSCFRLPILLVVILLLLLVAAAVIAGVVVGRKADKKSPTNMTAELWIEQKTKEDKTASPWLIVNTTEATTRMLQTDNNNIQTDTDGVALLHVTPLSLGIPDVRGDMITLIDRNTIVPAKASQIQFTLYDNQDEFILPIYAGERRKVADNHLLGILILRDITLTPRGMTKSNLTLQVFTNGTLYISIEEIGTTNRNNLTISNYHHRNDIENDVGGVTVLHVTPSSIGIENSYGYMMRLIERNTTVPATASKIVTTGNDNLEAEIFRIWEGEQPKARNNYFLTIIGLSDITVAPKEVTKFNVTLHVFANGTLYISVEEIGTTNRNNATIRNYHRRNDIDNDMSSPAQLHVTTISVGIGSDDDVMNMFIARNTTIPTRFSKNLTTVVDNQTSINLPVYAGERPRAKENHFLGNVELTGITAAPRGTPTITVTFEIDSYGTLYVSAREIGRNNRKIATITNILQFQAS